MDHGQQRSPTPGIQLSLGGLSKGQDLQESIIQTAWDLLYVTSCYFSGLSKGFGVEEANGHLGLSPEPVARKQQELASLKAECDHKKNKRQDPCHTRKRTKACQPPPPIQQQRSAPKNKSKNVQNFVISGTAMVLPSLVASNRCSSSLRFPVAAMCRAVRLDWRGVKGRENQANLE